MPYKDPEVRKAYHKLKSRKHYEENREEVIKKTAEKKKQFKKEWTIFKCTLKCTKCGFDHPAALDFHHVDPSKKEANIHKLLSNGQHAKLRIELEKCIVLCSNCHRIHHYEEKNPHVLGGGINHIKEITTAQTKE
jgi:hypothetical protein